MSAESSIPAVQQVDLQCLHILRKEFCPDGGDGRRFNDPSLVRAAPRGTIRASCGLDLYERSRKHNPRGEVPHLLAHDDSMFDSRRPGNFEVRSNTFGAPTTVVLTDTETVDEQLKRCYSSARRHLPLTRATPSLPQERLDAN